MTPSIEVLAVAFRRAIEVSEVRSDIAFSTFPRGGCGDASLLLSKFLRFHGFDHIDYVLGWARGGEPQGSHAWLEIDGTIVDIAADQFESRPAPPVLITTDRKWHAHFQEAERHSAKIDDYDPVTQGRLLTLYRLVLEHVPGELGGQPDNAE